MVNKITWKVFNLNKMLDQSMDPFKLQEAEAHLHLPNIFEKINAAIVFINLFFYLFALH